MQLGEGKIKVEIQHILCMFFSYVIKITADSFVVIYSESEKPITIANLRIKIFIFSI